MNSPSKTLVLLSPAFAAYEGDNWLPAQANLVRTLNKLYPSLKIVIISFHYPARTQPYEWYGNRIIPFGNNKTGKWQTILRWRKVWNYLRSLKQQERLLGIFSFFCSESAFVGHYFAQRNGLKHLIWVLGQDAKPGNKQVRRIKPAADELVCISDFLQKEFYKNYGIQPAQVIPIGIVPEYFSSEEQDRTIDLLGVGSLIPLKRYDLFIDVVKIVVEQLPDLRAAIVGGGPEFDALQQKIVRLQLEKNIQLTGEKSYPETLEWMRRSKLLLHPSAYEGLGMVNLEAIYTGAHAISFCQPFDQEIPHWHIVKDVPEMATKALQLLQNVDTDYSSQQPFLMDDTARQLMALMAPFD